MRRVGLPVAGVVACWCNVVGLLFGAELGPMKWGIAKVIANAEVPPAVLPFYHLGMEEAMPQQHSNDIIHSMPAMGKHITVQVRPRSVYRNDTSHDRAPLPCSHTWWRAVW